MLKSKRNLMLLLLTSPKGCLGSDALGDIDARRVEEPNRARLVTDRMHGEIDEPLASVAQPVREGRAENLSLRGDAYGVPDAALHLAGAAPPTRRPERLVEHLVARVSAPVHSESIDLSQRTVEVEDPANVPDWLKTDSNFAVAARSCSSASLRAVMSRAILDPRLPRRSDL